MAARTRSEVFEAELLPLRAKVLEIASGLDRLDRASGELSSEKLDQLREAIAVLQESGNGRAERVQLIFSRPYEAEWRQQMEVPAGSSGDPVPPSDRV